MRAGGGSAGLFVAADSMAAPEPRPASVTQAAGISEPGRSATVVGREIHEPSAISCATTKGIVLLLSKQSSFGFPAAAGRSALALSWDGTLVSVNLGTTSTLIVIEALEVRPIAGAPARQAADEPSVPDAQSSASANGRGRSDRRRMNPLQAIHHHC